MENKQEEEIIEKKVINEKPKLENSKEKIKPSPIADVKLTVKILDLLQ